MVKIKASPGARLNLRKFRIYLGKYKKASETVKVWERKYFVGEGQLQCNNSDGPYSSILRTSHKDRVNSGQFFPNKGVRLHGRTVGGYTNNGVPVGGYGEIVDMPIDYTGENDLIFNSGRNMSKTCIVSYDEFSREDEEIDVNMSNLKEVERDAQADEYRKATNLDNYDIMNFSPVIHPALAAWLKDIGSYIQPHIGMSLQYDKVIWEDSKYPKWLRQEGNFWQPGGHYFAWSDRVLRTKCYILGPVQTVYEADFVHHKHQGGKEEVMDAGHAYAGYGRVQYTESKYWTTQALGLDESGTAVDLLTQARNGIMGGNG